MKKFIAFVPQQGWNKNTGEDLLKKAVYIPKGNSRLTYETETSFPLIPLINGYAEPGDSFRVILIAQDLKAVREKNLPALTEELQELCERNNLIYTEPVVLEVPADNTIQTHLGTFLKLMDVLEDDDDIHACLTYGSKPAPMIELTAIRYARMIRKNTSVSCLVYGEYNWESNEMCIYDVTAIAQLDDVIRTLADLKAAEPDHMLKMLLSLSEDE